MKVGTGWLGWTEQETLSASMDVIVAAYEARIEMIRFMTGRPAPQPTIVPASPPAGTPMSPKLFTAMFGKNK